MQLIDDINGITLASSSSTEKSIKEMELSRKETAELIGRIPIHWRKNLRNLLIEYKKLELSKS